MSPLLWLRLADLAVLVVGASANEGREVGPIGHEVQEVKASKKAYVPSCRTFGFGLEVGRT